MNERLKMADEMWAWITQYPDGSWGLISAMIEPFGHMPLIGRNEDSIKQVEAIARAHAQALGQKIMLRKYVRATDYVEFAHLRGLPPKEES